MIMYPDAMPKDNFDVSEEVKTSTPKVDFN